MEERLNLSKYSPKLKRAMGILAVLALLAPIYLLTAAIVSIPIIGYICEVLLLYLTLGNRSLLEHARAVASELNTGNLDTARQRAGLLVSRETSVLTEVGLIRATVESVLENGNDAIFGSIFWFLCVGVPGAVVYRLANTLDAMWGYTEPHFIDFGWAAARLDDLLNYLPARITALCYAFSGNFSRAWSCWRAQAQKWYSPNAGAVMSAGAGSLGIELGGPAMYHGKVNDARPVLGEGDTPKVSDIERSISLVHRSLAMWLLISVVMCLSVWR